MNSIPLVLPSDFEEKLRFEMLLTELSARFVSATPETIDAEIVNARKQIAWVLGWYRSTLAQSQEPGRFVVTLAGRSPAGHISVQTTGKYLGCKQRLREALNDRIGIEPS